MGEIIRIDADQGEENRAVAGRVDGEPRTNPGPQRLLRSVVGEELKTIRTERGQRLVDVAGDAGVSPQYLSEVERGRKEPSSEILESVAGAMGYSVGSLMRRAYRLTSARVARPAEAPAPVQGAARSDSFGGSGPVLLAA